MSTGNEIERERSESEAEPQIFSARLTPHRSLNRTGFLAVMLFLSAVSFVTGLAFLMMGAWPVFGFFGLDVLVIWWAFKANFRAARASEEIVVTPSELRVRRVSQRGQVLEWTFNPLWVRLDMEIDEGFWHRASLSDLARPPDPDRPIPGAGREGKLLQRLG
ncbi:putative membrane protein [Bradyrhizobium sp. LM3.4]